MIAQGFWQGHYQILSIIFLKEFIELKCKLGHDDNKVKRVQLNISIVTVLEYANFKDDLIEYKCLYCNKRYQRELGKS